MYERINERIEVSVYNLSGNVMLCYVMLYT